MGKTMEEKTFLDFYKNTILSSSKNFQHFICKKLEEENKITFDGQKNTETDSDVLYFDSKKDIRGIISKTTTTKSFIEFYEKLEFKKLYKYSVPFYYEDTGKNIDSAIEDSGIKVFSSETYKQEYVIDRMLNESSPIAYKDNDKYFVKFVLQKAYLQSETFEQIDYRYPIVIYIDSSINMLEIRYDSIRYSFNDQVDRDVYSKMVAYCIEWIKTKLKFKLFRIEHADTTKVINDIQNTEVRIYKQMMEMKSGGSAELTASENGDYMLPFLGELRELIEENEELFSESQEIKQLLLQYHNEKEATASYPYIYVKWIKPVETLSYIVKITFDYFEGKYTLLQHITGNCKDLGMERMNDAIKYLSKSGSFVKGEEI